MERVELEVVLYEKEELSHNMFAEMDWEIDSIMREIERPAVALLSAGK